MVNILKTAYDKYFNTLISLGYISNKETKILSVLMFLRRYIQSNNVSIGDAEIIKLNSILDCLKRISCTIYEFPQIVKNNGSSTGNMLTQNGITIISNATGENLSTQSNGVQRFSDFAFQSSLGTEDFLAGYDSSLNTNIRVNAGSLVLSWQPI